MANFLEVFRSKSGALILFPVKLHDVPENEVKIVDFGHSLVLVSYFRPLMNPPENLFNKTVNFFIMMSNFRVATHFLSMSKDV